MSVILGLLAALSYGISDFLGGIASRRIRAVTVLLWAYPIGTALMIALLPLFPGSVDLPTVLWSAAGGACGFIGVLLMYSAMAIAPLNVISPLTATSTAAVPVIGGVAAGERPGALAWLGIALGFAAIAMVSRSPAPEVDPASAEPTPHATPRAILLALLAGVGFGAYFICLAQADHASGMWPVVLARLCSCALAVAFAWRMAALIPLPRTAIAVTIGAGVLDAAANGLFLFASREGYLSLVGVLTSLYPAGTIALAVLLLHERTNAIQRVGFVAAGAAVLLLMT